MPLSFHFGWNERFLFSFACSFSIGPSPSTNDKLIELNGRLDRNLQAQVARDWARVEDDSMCSESIYDKVLHLGAVNGGEKVPVGLHTCDFSGRSDLHKYTFCHDSPEEHSTILTTLYPLMHKNGGANSKAAGQLSVLRQASARDQIASLQRTARVRKDHCGLVDDGGQRATETKDAK